MAALDKGLYLSGPQFLHLKNGWGISEPQNALPWEGKKALSTWVLRNWETLQGGSGVQNTFLYFSPVLKRTQQVQEKVLQLNEKGEWDLTWLASCPSTTSPVSAKTFTSPFSLGLPVTQGLGDAGHDRDFIRSEVFRQMKAVLAGNESSCEPCPLDWKFFQGSCYFFSLDNLTWTQANDSCVQKQAHLVIINSRTEQVGHVES
uniref:Uncharacterized protein n=2 Tax=Canis lupus familiaris TaxID=9615 RepID=A0A8C0RR71_CANLF